jgi:UDP-glucose 4-epimerase
MKRILVTGGAGYIGSHMVYSLLENGYDPIIVDNFKYSTEQNLNTIEKKFGTKLNIIKKDIRENLDNLNAGNIDAVIHFAALKTVSKSVEKPIECYENNVYGSLNLLKWVRDNNIKKFIFSSTAAVYGDTDSKLIKEDQQLNPKSPYAKSKLFIEEILKDMLKPYELNSVVLRYFNVAGNLDNGEIGDLQSNPQSLIPRLILSHLVYRKDKVKVYGNDYPTRDGTGIRDYIHIMDLVDAHLKALEFLNDNKGNYTFNLGNGEGISVLEVIKSFEKVVGEKLSYEIAPRRSGDIVISTCDATKAAQYLNWVPNRSLEDMIKSMWIWYSNNFQK